MDFSELAIKGRGAAGNILTKHAVRRIALKDEGVSTLGAISIWFDDTVLRLNSDNRGKYLGDFKGDEKILSVYSAGNYRVMNFDLSNHFEENPLILEKLSPETVITAVYYDAEQGFHYIKRFKPESNGKVHTFLGDNGDNKLILVTTEKFPRVKIRYPESERRQKTEEEIDVHEFIAVKSMRARGKRLANTEIKHVEWLEPLVKPETTEVQAEPQKSDESEVSQEQQAGLTQDQHAEDVAGGADEETSVHTEQKREKESSPGDKQKQIRLDLDI